MRSNWDFDKKKNTERVQLPKNLFGNTHSFGNTGTLSVFYGLLYEYQQSFLRNSFIFSLIRNCRRNSNENPPCGSEIFQTYFTNNIYFQWGQNIFLEIPTCYPLEIAPAAANQSNTVSRFNGNGLKMEISQNTGSLPCPKFSPWSL